MNRRSFLRGLFTASAIVAVAPELLIPDGKVFSFPSRIITPSYTIGQYADYVNFSDLAIQTTIQPLLVEYYNKRFVANLKAQLSFEEMFKIKSLPPAGFQQINLYQPNLA